MTHIILEGLTRTMERSPEKEVEMLIVEAPKKLVPVGEKTQDKLIEVILLVK